MLDYIVSAVFFMEKSRIKAWELALLLALCFCLCEASVEAGRRSGLSEGIIRLHVIADSDDDAAQELKMRVRDAALPEIYAAMENAESAAEAESALRAGRDAILAAAESAAEGENVELLLGRERYGYRETEDYALPAGEYTSLRIIIGEGAGHNWWGVIFPQLEAVGEYGPASALPWEKEKALILEDEGLEIRFYLLELLRDFFRS